MLCFFKPTWLKRGSFSIRIIPVIFKPKQTASARWHPTVARILLELGPVVRPLELAGWLCKLALDFSLT